MFPFLLLLCVPFFATPDDEVRRTREFRPAQACRPTISRIGREGSGIKFRFRFRSGAGNGGGGFS